MTSKADLFRPPVRTSVGFIGTMPQAVCRIMVQSTSKTGAVETYEYAPDGSKKKTVQLDPTPLNCSFQVEGGEAAYPARALLRWSLSTTHSINARDSVPRREGTIVNRVVLRYNERGLVVEESQIGGPIAPSRHSIGQTDPAQIEMLPSVFKNASRTFYHYDEHGRKIKKEILCSAA